MKKEYKAIATVTDGEREWDVVIYSLYKTIEEANDGISRFAAHGYNYEFTRDDGFCDRGERKDNG